MAQRTVGVRVMTRIRQVRLAWPRTATAILGSAVGRRAGTALARASARRGLSRLRALPVASIVVDGAPVDVGPVDEAPLVVRRAWHSAAYVRIAGAVDRDAETVPAVVLRTPILTPNQRLLLDMSWTEARPILYQPVDGPDVADWTLVRRCDDRFELMARFLAQREIVGNGLTFVDLACNYGWFVQAMGGLGFTARGVELDERAPELARRFYGLDADQIIVGDALEFLRDPGNDADVMSCFSLVHHFVAAQQIELVDQVMSDLGRRSRVGFFFDMGQAHEGWLRDKLDGWTAPFIADRLRSNNPDMTVHALGIDRDARGEHSTEYGRTIFAVWR